MKVRINKIDSPVGSAAVYAGGQIKPPGLRFLYVIVDQIQKSEYPIFRVGL